MTKIRMKINRTDYNEMTSMPEIDRSAVANRIKATRTKLGYSQRDLADALGVGRSTVAHWERQSGFLPSTSHLNKLATLLQVKIDWLAFGTPINAFEPRQQQPMRRNDIETRLVSASRHIPVTLLSMIIALLESIGEAA
ncbi:helix-turn-helix domain-containing protein [Xanthomonas campestris]|uniref:helix-turn-helix domain-containing protein n=1 Tax=Xanthomonas TaxID=338 RepID=UPI001E2D97F4|nr:helix-turn-helix transcriptional regulator [Xanthomonas campestris]MCC5091277.1 helix-turn-helix domain-containing protein [Xanthomonas campestris]